MIENGIKLSNMAYKSLYVEGLSNDDFVMVCVEWASEWRVVIQEFLPDEDWEANENPDNFDYASGLLSFSFCELLCEYFPEYTDVLMAPPPPGKVKAIALADGGYVMYEISPSPAPLQ